MPATQVDLTLDVKNVLPVANGGAGGGVRAVTGTTDTISSGDNRKLITYSNAAAVAVSITAAPTLGGLFVCWVENLGAGTVTLTPASGTIDGSASLALTQDQGLVIWSDGSNFLTSRGMGSGGGGGTLGTQNGGYSQADLIPGSPNTLDDEFNGSSFDTVKWTVNNQETTTFTERSGVLVIDRPMTALDHLTYISQTLPATPWAFTTKVSSYFVDATQATYAGIALGDATTNLVAFSLSRGYGLTIDYWNNLTGSFNVRSLQNSALQTETTPVYLRISSDGTTLSFYWSRDGIAWFPIATRSATAFLTSGPTTVGLFAGGKISGVDCIVSFDWFRRTA